MGTTQATGFRISGGAVYRVDRRGANGRPLGAGQYLGEVWREGRNWRNDQVSDTFRTQEEAARSLTHIVQ